MKFGESIDERIAASDTYYMVSNSQIFNELHTIKNPIQIGINDLCNNLSSIDKQGLSKEPHITRKPSTNKLLDSSIFEMKNDNSETRWSDDDDVIIFQEHTVLEKGHSEVFCKNEPMAIDDKCLSPVITSKMANRNTSYPTIQTYMENTVSKECKQGDFEMVSRSCNIDSAKSTPLDYVNNECNDSKDPASLYTNNHPSTEISEYKTYTLDENLLVMLNSREPRMSKSDDKTGSGTELTDAMAIIKNPIEEIDYSDNCKLTNHKIHYNAEDLLVTKSITRTLQQENYSKCDHNIQTDQLNVASQHTETKLNVYTPKFQFITLVLVNIIGSNAQIQQKTRGIGNRKFSQFKKLAINLKRKTHVANKSCTNKHVRCNDAKLEITCDEVANSNEFCISDFQSQTLPREPCKKLEQLVQTEEKAMFVTEQFIQTDEIDMNVTDHSTQSDKVYTKTSEKGIQKDQAAMLREQISQTEELALFTFEQSAQTDEKNKSTKEEVVQTYEMLDNKTVQTENVALAINEECTQTEDNIFECKA
ncbi:uncharacterized protein LOC106674339 [Cimex lectularius]|uniref:Uncharacterized protein n=1 Tax=Cimex lectularius TaxID=79782 RepID=A0A8I6SQZ5_CIMLE|nr:uncharacterized protein LOC106674339 [Cimex lectularius]